MIPTYIGSHTVSYCYQITTTESLYTYTHSHTAHTQSQNTLAHTHKLLMASSKQQQGRINVCEDMIRTICCD